MAAAFLESQQVHRWALKRFLIEQAERLKTHARRMANAAGRSSQYLREGGIASLTLRVVATQDEQNNLGS